VELEVRYDSNPVPIMRDRAKEWLKKEPDKGQQVVLVLKNKTKRRLAAVLAINGKNTLYEEDVNGSSMAATCSKWLLEPGARCEIKGFYQDDNGKFRRLRVLSEEESDEEELNGNPHLGKIQLLVFQEGDAKQSNQNPARGTARKGLRRALPDSERPDSPKAAANLAERISGAQTPRAMGYIARGNLDRDTEIQSDAFRNPQLQESHVITYKQPAKATQDIEGR
jgi:hypothetical protein